VYVVCLCDLCVCVCIVLCDVSFCVLFEIFVCVSMVIPLIVGTRWGLLSVYVLCVCSVPIVLLSVVCCDTKREVFVCCVIIDEPFVMIGSLFLFVNAITKCFVHSSTEFDTSSKANWCFNMTDNNLGTITGMDCSGLVPVVRAEGEVNAQLDGPTDQLRLGSGLG